MKFLNKLLSIIIYPLTYLNFWKLKEKAKKSKLFKKIYFLRCDREKCLIFPNQQWAETPTFVHGVTGIIINDSSYIGKNCKIFQYVQIVNSGIRFNPAPKIGDDVVIGACAILIGSIVIGNNVIIGAGSVVTKSVPDNCMVAGNPAKIIKIFDQDKQEWIKVNKT